MTESPAGPAGRRNWLLAGMFLLVAMWIVWLRQPARSIPIWNVDEAITAAIGDEILAGGVPFRDATDLRAPLTYYFYAAVFAVAGRNDMNAIHAAHTLLVAATALLVLLVGRRISNSAGAGWAAWVYAGLACALFNPMDNFALHTEWPLAFCSAAGAWLYLMGLARRRAVWQVAAGAAYGLAVLSKQPALLDLGAPLALQAWLILRGSAAERRRHWRDAIVLLLGFVTPLVLTAGYFAARGAFDDFVYYTWTYNTRYYVPEVAFADRWPTVRVPLGLLHGFAPSLLALLGISLLATAARFLRRGRVAIGNAPVEAFAPIWLFGALAATTLSGRGFEHYSIQVLAPASLVAGQWLGLATDWAVARWRKGGGQRLAAAGTACALAAVVALQARHGFSYRAAVKPHSDPAVAMAQIVRELTTRQDRIFVWGFYSDFHTLADRLPASRFVHGAFLTGLIPWTNLGRDTSYAVVPGSMETLLADLEKNRPRVIVDASGALNRRFEGYPPEKFPPFHAYLREHYIEYEPQHSVPRGWFRFFVRREATPPVLSASAPAASAGPVAVVAARHGDFSDITRIAIRGSDPQGQLTHLGVRLGDGDWRGVTFPPSRDRLVIVPVPASAREVRLVAVAADGRKFETEPLPAAEAPTLPPALALHGPRGEIHADRLDSVHTPVAVEQVGRPTWLCHAYSAVRFPLPKLDQLQLDVGYGLPPGAHEHADASTDGVEFVIQLQPRDGTPIVLHRRLLDPRNNPADRGLQTVRLKLPALNEGDGLVLVTHPGPAYSTAYDWSYWTIPQLTTGAANPAIRRQ